jgi:hypothetical protein
MIEMRFATIKKARNQDFELFLMMNAFIKQKAMIIAA